MNWLDAWMMYAGYAIAISTVICVAVFFVYSAVFAISEYIQKAFRETAAQAEFLYTWMNRKRGKILSKKDENK